MALQSFSLHASLRAPERIWRPRPVERSLASTYRNRERKRRAHAHLALHPDPPAVELDELAAQGQAQARPFGFLLRRPHLSELLEHLLLILRGDTDAGVADRHLDRAISRRCRNLDSPTLWREFDRIGEQIQDDLPDLSLVGPYLAQLPVDVCVQSERSPSRPLADRGQGAVGGGGGGGVRP